MDCYSCSEKVSDQWYETLCNTILCIKCADDDCKCILYENLTKKCGRWRFSATEPHYNYHCDNCGSEFEYEDIGADGKPDRIYVPVYINDSKTKLLCNNCDTAQEFFRLSDILTQIAENNYNIYTRISTSLFKTYRSVLAQICTYGLFKVQFDIFSKRYDMFMSIVNFGNLTDVDDFRTFGSMSQVSYMEYIKFISTVFDEYTDLRLDNYNCINYAIRIINIKGYAHTNSVLLYDISKANFIINIIDNNKSVKLCYIEITTNVIEIVISDYYRHKNYDKVKQILSDSKYQLNIIVILVYIMFVHQDIEMFNWPELHECMYYKLIAIKHEMDPPFKAKYDEFIKNNRQKYEELGMYKKYAVYSNRI